MCKALRYFTRIQARALKLGGRDVNLGLYIGIHNKRQDIIYSDYLQMKSHNQILLLTSIHHSLASAKRTTGFTREYLPLVSYYW